MRGSRRTRRTVLSLLAAGALTLALAGPAAADVTHSFSPPFDCSATAFTPVVSGASLDAKGGESCGGSQFNYGKSYKVCLQFLGADGVTWFNAAGGCATAARSTANPYRVGLLASFFTGRHYRTEVSNANVDDGNGNGQSMGPVDSQSIAT